MPAAPWTNALEALEWEKVVSRLCAHAASDPGRDLCGALLPGTDVDAIRISLEENRDGRRMLVTDGPLPLEGVREIRPSVEKAEKGISLSAGELLHIGQTARAGERTRRFFEERRGRYPRLAHHAREVPRLRELADEIDHKIDASGNVLDRASPTLGSMRRQVLTLKSRLQKTADGIIASPRFARHIQEAYATVRSGRAVIPLKAAAKGLFPGIVHDTSQSGQTVFFEPEELVYLNNEIRMAEIEVEREIARILAEASAGVARRSADLSLCLAILSRLDFLQARCLLAEELSAAEPTVNTSGAVNLIGARHPLMVLARKQIVPNDLALKGPCRCLILTGPNAGGKTVALKTLGLLTFMAMAGLSIPASGDSSVSVFPRVFAAMGDEQSVEQDLSTYSAHVRRLNEIAAGADPGSLVLLDEVVTGTDPREGAAIARGFLETLADREVRVLATTHFEELKGIAFEDPRFENGSMEFDREGLRPTYRLRLGIPGRSMAMEIARSLGFPEEILARAKRYLPAEDRKLDEVLVQLEREREKVAREAAELSERRRRTEEERRLLRAERDRARAEQARLAETGRTKIREEIRKAEEELRRAAEDLRRDRKIETMRNASAVVREWKDRARTAEQDPAVQAMMSRTAPLQPEGTLVPGQKVFLAPLYKEGEVTARAGPREETVEVLVGGMKTRVSREQVRVLAADRHAPAPAEAGTPRGPGRSAVEVYLQTPANTLDLRGMYVDDALPEVDAFLDRLSLSQASHAFVVHGHGTGALKTGVRRHLKDSPYAKRFFAAPREQGGDGATIVILA